MSKLFTGTVAVSVAAAMLMVAAPAHAQKRFTLTPSVAISAISDDNIFTTEERSADQTTLFAPGLEGAFDGTRASVRGSYAFDMLRSAYFTSLNNIEARRRGMFDGHYRMSPKTALTLGSHYDRSENAGELNFESALLVPRRRATRWELNPGFTYRSSPLVTWRGSYNWVREDLERTMIANEHVARLGVTREVSSRTSLSLGYLGRHFVNSVEARPLVNTDGTQSAFNGDAIIAPATGDIQTSHALLFGWNRQLWPHVGVTIVAGPRLSSRGELAPEITGSFVRHADGVMGYAFDYWRGESIILGVLGPVEVESGTGRVTWPLFRTVEIGAAAGTFTSSSLTQGEAHVRHAEATATWTPASFYSVSASYGADFQHGDIRSSFFTNRSVERHVFLVKLTIAPRLTREIQPRGPVDPLAGPTRRESNRDQ